MKPRVKRSGHLSEYTWQGMVLQLARATGWTYYHTRSSRGSVPGFPDLVLVRGDRLIFAELKAQDGDTSTAQDRWLALLEGTSAEVYVWRPSDLDQVKRTLELRA